jgi:hypothetical protein
MDIKFRQEKKKLKVNWPIGRTKNRWTDSINVGLKEID